MTEEIIEKKPIKLGLPALEKAAFITPTSGGENPWAADDVDKLEFKYFDGDEFAKVVDACRFFYKKDPLAQTILNKLVDLSITDIIFTKGTLSDNEYRIFEAMKEGLHTFSESIALEYNLSGLVVPEIKYGVAEKEVLEEYNIKKYDHLFLPLVLWLRDPTTIKINSGLSTAEPSYFVKIPDKLLYFILNEGTYPDGTKDEQAYIELLQYYPDFVAKVKAGEKEILLDNDLIIRRRFLTDSPYPVPYLYAAIEPMKHKRNMRRMDYSIAARVISAIQVITLGNDDFPLTEDDQEQFDSLKAQMYWRNSGNRDQERIFQLFGNHTLHIEWIYPPTDVLLNDAKYIDINQDIFFALGFPRMLVVGEAERSNAGNSQYTSLSPVKTMEAMRRKILRILQKITSDVADKNNLKYTPKVRFSPLRLEDFQAFTVAINNLYTTGNLSGQSYAATLGYDFEDEIRQKAKEEELKKTLGLDDVTKAKEMQEATNPPEPMNKTTNPDGNNSKKPDK